MKFVRGGDLKKHLTNGRISEDDARFYAIQIALALGYLHSNQIMHRDIKPGNILMDADGYISVTDFGLAKIIETNEVAQTFCGTHEYLAPEMVAEAGHNFAVDWWALGVLIYEMITGIKPFYTGGNNIKKMYAMIMKK